MTQQQRDPVEEYIILVGVYINTQVCNNDNNNIIINIFNNNNDNMQRGSMLLSSYKTTDITTKITFIIITRYNYTGETIT